MSGGSSFRSRRLGRAVVAMLSGCAVPILGCAGSTNLMADRSVNWDSTTVANIKEDIGQDSLPRIPEQVFGKGFDPSLADLVVYIPDSSKVAAKCVLTRDGKELQELRGERFLWVMVLAEAAHGKQGRNEWEAIPRVKQTNTKIVSSKGANDEEKTDTVTTLDLPSAHTVRVEALEQRLGFGESAVLQGLGKVFGLQSPSSSGKALRDSVHGLILREVSDGANLFFGMVKLPIQSDTRYRIRTRLHDRSAYFTFDNHSDSQVGASLGLIARSSNTGLRVDMSRPSTKPYILFHLYLARPNFPRNRSYASPFGDGSVSMVGGLKLSQNFTDDVFIGVGFGHMIHSVGLIAGFNYHGSPPLDQNGRPAFSVGLSYGL